MTAQESIGNPLPMTDTERDANTGGSKTTSSDPVPTSPEKTVGGSRIVYVRRKPETDLTKTKLCVAQIDCPRVMNSSADQARKLDNPLICASDVAPFGSSAAENIGHGNGSDSNSSCWEERYCRLQNILKMLDQSDQHKYVEMLRSLSSVELSGHAVELEKRSIDLSMEEAREIRRGR